MTINYMPCRHILALYLCKGEKKNEFRYYKIFKKQRYYN